MGIFCVIKLKVCTQHNFIEVINKKNVKAIEVMKNTRPI